jgi:hypothetical protein
LSDVERVNHFIKEFFSVAEPVLLAGTCWAYARSKAYRGIPAFGAYLACRLAVCVFLVALIYAVRFSLVEKHAAYAVYYYVYWIGYLIGSAMALLAIQEIFKYLMKPVPGLGRYGLMAFRWVTLTSVLIGLAMALYPTAQNWNPLVVATSGAMRCVSILELCLLAFVLVSMQTLQISPRSREFGVALGLGIIAAADLFGSAFAFGHSTLSTFAAYSAQIVVTFGSVVWMVYFVRPAVEAHAIVLRESSPLRRWNEIASALAPPTPNVALPPPSSNFFLQDVERAVDRVLKKNSGNAAS